MFRIAVELFFSAVLGGCVGYAAACFSPLGFKVRRMRREYAKQSLILQEMRELNDRHHESRKE